MLLDRLSFAVGSSEEPPGDPAGMGLRNSDGSDGYNAVPQIGRDFRMYGISLPEFGLPMSRCCVFCNNYALVVDQSILDIHSEIV